MKHGAQGRRDADREGRGDLAAIPAKAVALAEQGGALTAEIAKLALMPQDSPTRFKGKPGVAKRVAWAEPLPLDEVKAVGKALGASVNDVLLSCVAGALREYLVAQGRRDRRRDDPRAGARSTCVRSRRPTSSATSSGSCSSICRSASRIRSSGCTRCART